MAKSLTNFWLKFFKDAGIGNTSFTAVYATTFAENEIKEDMVIDLTRDILRDLGITMMGHVLAILKHAKTVHSQTVNEKIIANTNPVVQQQPIETEGRIPMNTSPMTRIIEHYVKQSDYETPESMPAAVKTRLVSTVPSPKLADRLGDKTAKPTSSLKVTDRLGILKPAPVAKRKSITLKPTHLKEEVPVKRIRKVLPEEEGAYKITMPLGNTPRTKSILAKLNIPAVQSTKPKTVFERLGESSVSSTTCVDEPKVTFSGMGSSPKAGGPSVFMRLGGKRKLEITSTIVSESEKPDDESIGYHGVLKKNVAVDVKESQLNTKVKTRLGVTTKSRTLIKNNEVEGSKRHTVPTTLRNQKINMSALSRLGASTKSVDTPEPATRVVKKKFIKTLSNGKRVIVMRDVIEEIKSQPKVSKAVSFGECAFRSDKITKKAAVQSRLGEEDDAEWDY